MKRRLPDKPVRSHPTILKTLNTDRYIALAKYDGWSTLLEIGDTINFISRSGKPLNVDAKLYRAAALLAQIVPPHTTLWGEWMKHRPGYDGPECMVLFSPVYINNEFVGHWNFEDRFAWIRNLFIAADDINICKSCEMPDHAFYLPMYATNNFQEFFERQKDIPRSEGIVVYKRNGQYYGGFKQSTKTKDMKKIKYREGDNGDSRL